MSAQRSGEFGWQTCPLCLRLVSTYRNTDGHLAMLAHRVRFPHDPTTAWCDGGGRELAGELFQPVARPTGDKQ